jgi:hypothetical protein
MSLLYAFEPIVKMFSLFTERQMARHTQKGDECHN